MREREGRNAQSKFKRMRVYVTDPLDVHIHYFLALLDG